MIGLNMDKQSGKWQDLILFCVFWALRQATRMYLTTQKSTTSNKLSQSAFYFVLSDDRQLLQSSFLGSYD